MKQLKILSYISIVAIICFSCSNNTPQVTNNEIVDKGFVLSPLVKYMVIVKDTSINYMLREDSVWVQFEKTKDSTYFKKPIVTNVMFLPFKEFEIYKLSLYNVIKNEKVFITDNSLNVASSYDLRRQIYRLCDSLKDPQNPSEPAFYACDSTSGIDRTYALMFYEKWWYNKETGMITKELLAYSPMLFKGEFEDFFPKFYVFKNKDVYNEIKSKIQNTIK